MTARKKRDAAWYALFVLPLFLVFTIIVIIPFVIGVGYSFYSWDGLPVHEKVFVGFDNFKRLLSDTKFLASAGRTTVFTLISVLTINLLGFFFALLCTSRLKAKNILRTMLFMPYLIGGLILGYIWKFMLGEGLVKIGEVTGLSGAFFNWIIDKKMAFVALIIVATWQMAGYIMIIYITGIQSIPDDVIEASSIDGASYFQTLWYIKLPLIMPSFTICLFMTLSNCFKIFDTNLALTKGGPSNATEMFAMNIYDEIFKVHNYGYGQAKAIIFLIVVACFTLAQVAITKKKEVAL